MIVLDLETTGPDPKTCSVINIGAIDLDNPDKRFFEECKPFEGAKIFDFAKEYCGFTEEGIRAEDRLTQEEIFGKLCEWLNTVEDKTFAGQNIRFDINFLDEMAERQGKFLPFGHRFIDMHSVCYFDMKKRGLKVPLENNFSGLNTDKVMEYVGIPAEPKPHRKAITGATYEAEAFSRFFYGKNLLEEFKDYPVPEYLKQ